VSTVTGITAKTGTTAGAHRALFYEGTEDYASGIVPFLREGLAAGEPALVALPGARLGLIRDRLDDRPRGVTFVDMADLGRNPARLIPAVRQFAAAHAGRRFRAVGEPIWPGRSDAEIREAALHEALVNTAFAGLPAIFVCAYDASGLDSTVLRDARRTHPHIQQRGQHRPSTEYMGSAVGWAIRTQCPAGPPSGTRSFPFGKADLPHLRRYVRQHATRAGLSGERAGDLVVAVNEVATNTVLHARAPGILSIWQEGSALVCEVTGPGRIADPLAGRHLPAARPTGGHGLWLVNQVCDLTELRSGPWGTSIRLHMHPG